jgi:hypothetical protein
MERIIAVGSVDGVLTSAALIRFFSNRGDACEIHFTQAFTCQETLEFIEAGDWVYLVDLAVNNRDPEYTRQFVKGIEDCGAAIYAIADEHDAQAWNQIIPNMGNGEGELAMMVYPQTRSEQYPSSGAVLRQYLSGLEGWDDYCTRLTQYADLADQAEFVGLAEVVNKAVKSNIRDQHRRVYIAKHFSQSFEMDPQIRQWVTDYETLEANMNEILSNVVDRGKYIYLDSRGKDVDMTTLATRVYRQYPDALVVVAKGQAFDKTKGGVIPCYSFMASTNAPEDLNVQSLVGVPGFGFAKKFNVEDEEFEEALANLNANL